MNFLERTLRTSRVISEPMDLDIDSALVGVIFVYPIDEPLPQHVTMEWDLWNERIQRVPGSAVDEAGPLPTFLEPDSPVLEWRNFLKHPTLPTLQILAPPPGGLSRMAHHARWPLLFAAALALYRIDPDKLALPVLISALKDNDRGVRLSAASALGQIGPAAKEAVPALIAALKDKDIWVRRNAASALTRIGPAAKGTVPALIAALRDKQPGVRMYAAVALGNISHAAKEAVPALIVALKDKDIWVRRLAASALTNALMRSPPVRGRRR